MYEVIITYTNGETVRLTAQEFDIPPKALRRGGGGGKGGAGQLRRFTYKGATGTDIPIYLTPNQVSGIVVFPRADQPQTGGQVPDATEAARQKAGELGVDLSQVEGSGTSGRITVKDVTSAANRE